MSDFVVVRRSLERIRNALSGSDCPNQHPQAPGRAHFECRAASVRGTSPGTVGHRSRPAFYDRLAKIATILGADLDDVETCLSLHVALLAHDTR